MGILEQTSQMKSQGMNDYEISEGLRDQGYSPKDINEALNQSNIKSSVIGEYQEPEDLGEDYIPTPDYQEQNNRYQPTIQEVNANYPPQDYNQQQTYEQSPSQNYQEYYPQQGYDASTYQSNSTEYIMDVAEQVLQEKTKKIQKQVEDFEQFKNLAIIQMQNTSERLKRMELVFDKLQIAVIEKVGGYGKELSSLKKEVAMVEDSLSKVAKEKTESPHSSQKKTSKKRK